MRGIPEHATQEGQVGISLLSNSATKEEGEGEGANKSNPVHYWNTNNKGEVFFLSSFSYLVTTTQ